MRPGVKAGVVESGAVSFGGSPAARTHRCAATPILDPVDPDALLDDLDPEQRLAVGITRGPLAILAGAGSGKTRVISRRVAYAVTTGAVAAGQVLVVTFTEKAAAEMASRLRGLELRGVAARTFHAAALAQLRHFWPLRHGGAEAPEVLDSKTPIVGRLARNLPGGYRFTPAKDLADEIEWAKSRRLTPASYAAGGGASRQPPVPIELFVRLWADYELAKDRAGKLDFDDMLTRLIELLETDAEAAAIVRSRYSWFSVDEYQDTNPLQERLLELWLGDRDDLCVVGDEDQSIYSFTGATSAFLTGFEARHPGARVVTLERNYRSSPEILALANRLLAAEGRGKRLVATMPSGPIPTIRRWADAASELAFLTTTVARTIADGIAPSEIAVLVRTNAQIPPIEASLTRAGIAFRVRGQRFFERPEVREALRLLRRPGPARRGLAAAGVEAERPGVGQVTGSALVDRLEARLISELGYEPDLPSASGRAAVERNESLGLVLEIARSAVDAEPATDTTALLATFERRATAETEGSDDGVNLLTLHRAKGLEWDAVFLPQLEEGTLPISQALESEDDLAEERRLLYVGLTRARRRLVLSWAGRRMGTRDRETTRSPSRFLGALEPSGSTGAHGSTGGAGGRAGSGARGQVTVLPGAPMPTAAERRPEQDPLRDALRAWRTARANADAMPPYVIAHDSLLDAIVEQRPPSVAALRRLKGMGPAKLERYGEELLELVRLDAERAATRG